MLLNAVRELHPKGVQFFAAGGNQTPRFFEKRAPRRNAGLLIFSWIGCKFGFIQIIVSN